MKRFAAVVCAVLLLAVAGARAAGPDEQYIGLYGLIQEADQLGGAGDTRTAITKYLEAQSGLKALQAAHPDWNTKIIAFRLNYIASRLEPLTQKVASGAAGPVPVVVSPGQMLTNQIRQLQEDMTRMANQNALLEAKLREALTVQPASSDPRELAKAEEKLKVLQKERDLLAVSLEQMRAAPAPGGAGERQALDELKKQYAAQSSAMETLRRQNVDLQKQATAAKPSAGASSADVFQLRETIVMLQASNRSMQAEQVLMENKLLDWVRRQGGTASAREKELESQLSAAQAAATAARQERDELARKLADASRMPIERPASASADAPEKQLEVLRAKVQMFEAKAVPYTAEELALFKQPLPANTTATMSAAAVPPPAVAAASTPPAKKRRDEIPAAAAGMIDAASRALAGGRFDEAEKKIHEAIKMDDANPSLLCFLAGVQLDQNKTAEAEASVTKVLTLDPQHPPGLFIQGELRYRQDRFDEAIDALSQAAKLRPEHPETQYLLGRALIGKGNRVPAEAALRKAVQLRPSWGEPHYQLAVLYARQEPGYPELAQYHYKKAIAGGVPQNFELERSMSRPAAKKP